MNINILWDNFFEGQVQTIGHSAHNRLIETAEIAGVLKGCCSRFIERKMVWVSNSL